MARVATAHDGGLHHLHDLALLARTALWTAAIDKAKSMWGDDWGVAYNGEKVRTQCHTHIHIGKLMPHIETGQFIVVCEAFPDSRASGEGTVDSSRWLKDCTFISGNRRPKRR